MKTGHPKGAAFIEFTKKDGVNAAMDMNGKEVKGKFVQFENSLFLFFSCFFGLFGRTLFFILNSLLFIAF